ncbi:hypothetical protein F441_20795 [Phytophthora nicotianae CJ01A1]|uniref:Secreted protein n=4 Tax=Phytophthora nicotianae TaxID=4792 RepID=W2PIV0_PHYN3|nr:hypothetical protein PPTG_24303 [Phytophthora nicotianae INRA-310]ETK72555.1 hypothetical protein L915_20349 [Phytophthora nicotianae]ETP02041.1 hypothetical protein F441_20795 [Phytophthora nicotianae CJ01A1]ETP30203.1 hypothetical protein F442_20733 [Phytophthora nicotianae P10297]ETL26006.1 hypothetical protein L916_20212 [Phytophthora nicotianae]ETN00169.1 hypothetical protein PPTG_24303 [Phytophthora nicotianae INRA-310]
MRVGVCSALSALWTSAELAEVSIRNPPSKRSSLRKASCAVSYLIQVSLVSRRDARLNGKTGASPQRSTPPRRLGKPPSPRDQSSLAAHRGCTCVHVTCTLIT